ncbi:Histone H2B.2 [Abeliophyllum distichum]|uniref:Histone H2B.2 n=1 Tax=Abeliophyllum distichum TaxID=126358 RepID=A0ABD1VUJ3_9LAMI
MAPKKRPGKVVKTVVEETKKVVEETKKVVVTQAGKEKEKVELVSSSIKEKEIVEVFTSSTEKGPVIRSVPVQDNEEPPQQQDEEETQPASEPESTPQPAKLETPKKKEENEEKKRKSPQVKEGVKEKGKRKRKRGRAGGEGGEGYKRYLFKVMKQVHPDMGISSMAMTIINNLMSDMFERIAYEATRLLKITGRTTLSSREIQGAVKLVLPGELGKHAIAEGTKAVSTYISSISKN